MQALVQVALVVALLTWVAGLFSAAHAVLHSRSPQGAVAWALSLVFLPFVALPLYWFFGRWKYEGYVRSRRAGRKALQRLRASFLEAAKELEVGGGPRADLLHELRVLSGLPPTAGNQARLLIDGEESFADLHRGIDEAERELSVQFYSILDDATGSELMRRLARRAGEGLRVRLLYDNLGSWDLGDEAVRRLRESGVEVAAFEAVGRLSGRGRLNFRNHRKVAVADGRTAWVGGLNANDDCMGGNERLRTWRDTHLRLRGPAVQSLQLGFQEDWHWATGELPELEWEPRRVADPGAVVAILPSGPSDEVNTLALGLAAAIGAARSRIWLATPYFVPDERLTGALQLAALRGLDVRLLLPGVSDHRIVHLASSTYHADVAAVGVRVFRYTPGFLHQKVMLVDEDLSVIGTGNLDNRSLRLNFETAAFVFDEGLASELERALRRDLAASEEEPPDAFARRPLLNRIAARVARLFGPVL